MITNESEIRIAAQAVLASVLVLYGFWGCALVVVLILLPWKPILAVGSYLAQPLVDWRIRKARERHGKGIAQIEQELDALLRTSKAPASVAAPSPAGPSGEPARPAHPPLPRSPEPFKAKGPAGAAFHELPATAQSLSATMAIPPVIKEHVRSLPQGVFSNMDLEVEEVRFHGDSAEAYVRFQSPSVTELVLRQRYLLRQSGGRWQVESRRPANGSCKAPPQRLPAPPPPMHLT